MIRILSLFLLLCASIVANAQIKKGAVLLGGQLTYNRYSSLNAAVPNNNDVSKSGSFSISAGKAVKENAAFGLIASYAPSRSNFPYTTGTGSSIADKKVKQYSAGVFYRRYKQLFKDLYIFGEGTLSYTGMHQSELFASNGFKSIYTEHGGQLYFTPGISYNLFKKLQAELLIPSLLSISYTRSNNDQQRFTASTGLQNTNLGYLGVGFHVIL
ncbi:MAG: hypothetical protein INR73_10500 [Williamsia sp.]|nr:hypothetical protein [Williamsia sp.]